MTQIQKSRTAALTNRGEKKLCFSRRITLAAASAIKLLFNGSHSETQCPVRFRSVAFRGVERSGVGTSDGCRFGPDTTIHYRFEMRPPRRGMDDRWSRMAPLILDQVRPQEYSRREDSGRASTHDCKRSLTPRAAGVQPQDFPKLNSSTNGTGASRPVTQKSKSSRSAAHSNPGIVSGQFPNNPASFVSSCALAN